LHKNTIIERGYQQVFIKFWTFLTNHYTGELKKKLALEISGKPKPLNAFHYQMMKIGSIRYMGPTKF